MIPNNFSLDLSATGLDTDKYKFWPGGRGLFTATCTSNALLQSVTMNVKSPNGINYVGYGVIDPATGAITVISNAPNLTTAFEFNLPAIGILFGVGGVAQAVPDSLQVRVSRIPK